MKRTPLKRKTPLRSMSKKRQKESKIYSAKRKAFLDAHPICQICESRPASEVHHRHGRYGSAYLDESTWLALCGPHGCHEWLGRNRALAKEMGLWDTSPAIRVRA